MPYDPFAVSPEERMNLKKHYSGTFIRLIIHAMGSFALAQVIFIAMMLFGYEFRYNEEDIAILDWPYCIAASIPSILFCIGIFIHDKVKSKISVTDYFRLNGISVGFAVCFFAILMFSYAVATFIQNLVIGGMFAIGISPLSEDYLTDSEINIPYIICEIVFTAVLAPVAEELLFRGVILRRLCNVSQTFGIVASALIFGLMHGNILQTILGFVIGIVFAYAAVKTGSLVLPVLGHIFINSFATFNTLIEFYYGTESAEMYWFAGMVIFFAAGLIALIAAFAAGKIKFPEHTEYHSRRTLPVMVRCVSFWIILVYYIYSVVSACGEVTDKLLGE